MIPSEKVHIAFLNSFAVLVNNKKVDELIGEFFAHNPARKPSQRELENILKYFIDIEDYEKCAMLKKYIDDKF